MNGAGAMRTQWFFDFDGTLFDTQLDIRLAWERTLAEIGRPCAAFAERYVTGPSLSDMVGILFPEAAADERAALVARVRAAFPPIYDGSGFPHTRPFPGALEWVRALKAGGARVRVATNKRLRPTRLILERHGALDLFDAIYTSDMYLGAAHAPTGVPTDRTLKKAEYLALALREEGIDPEDAVMVGDTAIDVAGARANGLLSIGVTWGYGTRAELADADVLLDSPPARALRGWEFGDFVIG